MNKFRFTIQTLAIATFVLAFASMAQAQASRTWVSGVGDDVNPCSRTAPCKTFAGAISKTATNGEINCLDPGGFGTLTITKSIQVDCHDEFASTLNVGTSGFIINFDLFGADVRKSVRLRNINIQGANTGTNGIRVIGGTAVTGTEVFIEDCLIDGQFGSPGRGIEDFRKGGGLLVVDNTTIRNVGNAAISVDPNAGGTVSSTQINVRIANSRIGNTTFGLNFGSNVKASIENTVITGVTNSGVFAVQNAGGSTEISVANSLINSNGTGVNASSAGTIIRVSNSTLVNNTTLFTAAGGGAVQSYGNNQTAGAALGVPVPGGQG